MKDMSSFTKMQIDEAVRKTKSTSSRKPRGSKNEVEASEEKVVVNGKVTDKEKAIKDAEKPNAAKSVKWAIDEPTSDDAAKYANKDEWDNNMKMLRSRLRAGKPFFCLGHAGWGKTAVIKSIAKKFGYTIITVYLDKAVPEDLDGIPVPMESGGHVYQERALPGWAAYMLENKDKKFLLFFDEMNQADPRVMNALMPIVQEQVVGGIHFYNEEQHRPIFIVGAAGNYKDENDAVSDMSEPLMERFAPIIKWEDNTPEAWSHNFTNYMHKRWDPKVGKEIVNEFEKNAQLFRSPRVIDQKMLEFIWNIKQLGEEEWDFYDADFYLKYMEGEGILVDDLKQSEKKDVQKLAEYIDAWMREDNANSKANNRSREILDAPPSLKREIESGMKNGWIGGDEFNNGDKTRWAFSRDLLPYLFNMDDYVDMDDKGNILWEGPITMEQIMQEVSKNEKKGIKFKFETAKEAVAAGYEVENDPKIRRAVGL